MVKPTGTVILMARLGNFAYDSRNGADTAEINSMMERGAAGFASEITLGDEIMFVNQWIDDSTGRDTVVDEYVVGIVASEPEKFHNGMCNAVSFRVALTDRTGADSIVINKRVRADFHTWKF